MAKRKYTVAGPHAILGNQSGETFTAEIPVAQEERLLASGALVLGEGAEPKPEKFACPACVEHGLKRPPKFESLDELQAHYQEKHQGLEPPDSVPSGAEEE